jgi:hypothetical protein
MTLVGTETAMQESVEPERPVNQNWSESSPQYNMDTDFRILDELDCPVWVVSYRPGEVGFFWANSSGLRLWDKPTLEAFTSTDISRGITPTETDAKFHQEIYADVQVIQSFIQTSALFKC